MDRLFLPRRRVLAASIAGATALSLPAVLRAAAAGLSPTPEQTEGPFYPLNYPADSDNDLAHVAGHAEPAKGTMTRVAGRVLDRGGRPVRGARVEIWQCDANGRYHNVRDGDSGRPRDENFQGFGQMVTDEAGGYRFLTIRPVAYTGRTPHIHFSVIAPGQRRFITQMYVAGEPQNERDPVLLGVRDPAARARLIVPLRAAPEIGREALAAEFDIVLA
ncbi:MAG: intradiol ring-cleavage dioxygenase [Alphaproteobacteria bacterium]|nr:MAG: intradiol ring-cleavage dioxygenase [Alphaproteobacteria bacterium]